MNEKPLMLRSLAVTTQVWQYWGTCIHMLKVFRALQNVHPLTNALVPQTVLPFSSSPLTSMYNKEFIINTKVCTVP